VPAAQAVLAREERTTGASDIFSPVLDEGRGLVERLAESGPLQDPRTVLWIQIAPFALMALVVTRRAARKALARWKVRSTISRVLEPIERRRAERRKAERRQADRRKPPLEQPEWPYPERRRGERRTGERRTGERRRPAPAEG